MLSQVPTLSPLSSLDRRACRGLWAHENMQSVSGMSNKYCLNITCSPMYFDENHRESTTSHCSSPGMVLVTASWVSMGLHFDPPCPKHICPMNFTLSGIKMFENRARKKWPLHGPTSENRIPQHLVVYDHQNGNELRAAAGVAHFQTRPAWYHHGTAMVPLFIPFFNPNGIPCFWMNRYPI